MAATALALAIAGCASSATQRAIIVTGEQVITSCDQNYFYNGILPQPAAKANCSSCVVQKLHKLGIRAMRGETEADVLTGVRLSNSDINSLQSTCDESDANAQ